jgi:hypothetical protein
MTTRCPIKNPATLLTAKSRVPASDRTFTVVATAKVELLLVFMPTAGLDPPPQAQQTVLATKILLSKSPQAPRFCEYHSHPSPPVSVTPRLVSLQVVVVVRVPVVKVVNVSVAVLLVDVAVAVVVV